MNKLKCPICASSTDPYSKKARSGETISLNHCLFCSFTYNSFDPSDSLSAGKLDKTRLSSVGFNLPSIKEDFKNGMAQSKYYADHYSLNTSASMRILDFGCSSGYFLHHTKELGHNVIGIELDSTKRIFINNDLGISCYKSTEELPKELLFDAIFLFYSLEYVPDFVELIKSLYSLLSCHGSIYIITPNLNDPLLKVWNSKSFNDFFYDFHSINYFSVTSLHNLMKTINITAYSLYTKQGYSLFNHLNWLFNSRPYGSKFMGEDKMTDIISTNLDNSSEYEQVKSQYINDLLDLNTSYASKLEELDLGNNIHLIIEKN